MKRLKSHLKGNRLKERISLQEVDCMYTQIKVRWKVLV